MRSDSVSKNKFCPSQTCNTSKALLNPLYTVSKKHIQFQNIHTRKKRPHVLIET